MRIVHLVTIHADAGRAAAVLIMAGLAAVLKEKRIAWWVSPPDGSDIKIMGRVPKDLAEVPLKDLLDVYYSMAPNETPKLED